MNDENEGLDPEDYEEIDRLMDKDDEPDHCTVCAGTGEGMFDSTRCNSCGGKGFAK